MKKLSVIITICIAILGCNRSQKQSVFKPLTLDELAKIVKKDTLFEHTYKYIQFVKDSVLKKDIDKAKWTGLTYGRVHKYYKLSMDTSFFKEYDKRFESEWNKKYSKYLSMTDSVINYWEKYKAENALDNYAQIEIADIDKNYYEYIGGIESIDLGWRITPLKGPIEQIIFSYRITAKIDDEKEKLDTSFIKRFNLEDELRKGQKLGYQVLFRNQLFCMLK